MTKELSENSLLSFVTLEHFLDFYKSLDIYKDWKITTGTMNYRGELIRSKPYSIMLQDIFRKKNMFRRNVSVAEIVSWLDGYKLIERLIQELMTTLPREIYKKIEIYSEYRIRMSKNMRIDYVLKYKDIILLLELRMVSRFEKIRPTWEKKKLELIVYKDLLRNYVFGDTKILNYALITLPEYKIKSEINKHIEYNANQIDHLMRYFIQFVLGQYEENSS